MRIVDHGTYYHIHIDFGRMFKFNLEVVRRVIPEKSWNPEKKVWFVKGHYKMYVEKVAITCKTTIIKHEDQPAEVVGEIEALPMPDYPLALNPKAPGTPMPYQKAGIARGIEFKSFLNGDEPGLGKTLQSIVTLATAAQRGEKVFPCLVICPATLKENWLREIAMWTGLDAMILKDSVKNTWHQYWQIGAVKIFITNYESLKKYFVEAMPTKKGKFSKSADIKMKPTIELFNSVIVDESHRVSDPYALQSKLVLRIAHGKQWVNLLTGTPIKNKPKGLFPQLAIMGKLHLFGGRKGYMERYCDGGDGASNLKELNFLLNKHCYFRREKKDVLTDLPDKQRQKIICEITTREEYEHAKRHFERWLSESGYTAGQISVAMRAEVLVQMGKLRSISARGKLEEVREFAQEVLDAGEKLILFCTLKEIVQSLLKMFPDAVTIVGGQTMEVRQSNIDRFQKDPTVQLIICNIQAGGVGCTLTASSRVGFIELPWTYADTVQAEDRAHRKGQKNAVMCTYFLGQDTIDEKMFDIIMEKKDIHAQVTGASDQMEISVVDKMISLFKQP